MLSTSHALPTRLLLQLGLLIFVTSLLSPLHPYYYQPNMLYLCLVLLQQPNPYCASQLQPSHYHSSMLACHTFASPSNFLPLPLCYSTSLVSPSPPTVLSPQSSQSTQFTSSFFFFFLMIMPNFKNKSFKMKIKKKNKN